MKQYPSFEMAHGNRADCLVWLCNLSNNYSITLLCQAYDGYRKAINSNKIPNFVIDEWDKSSKDVSEKLMTLGYDVKDINPLESVLKKNFVEFEEHSNYRKFCLVNKLCLSEHSL